METSELFVLATKLEDIRSKLMSGNDVNQISQLFSNDLYYGHASGLTDSKSSYLMKLENQVFRYISVQVNLNSVTKLDENAFLACGTENTHLIAGGDKKQFEFIYMGVWKKEANEWKFLGHQTAIAKK